MKKIGVLTFHNVYNYGGVLQAYALCKALDSRYDVACIDYRQPALQVKYSHRLYHPERTLKGNIKHFVKHFVLKKGVEKTKRINAFIKQYIPLSDDTYAGKNGSFELYVHYDVLVSGSDQVWNPQFTGGKLDPVYFLAFGNGQTRKISYASSAGAYVFNDSDKKFIAESLSSYAAISVRETFLQEQLQNVLGKEVNVVLDPTLLLDRHTWAEIEKPVHIHEDFILLYTFDNNPVCIEAAKKMAAKLHCKIAAIGGQRVRNSGIDFYLSDVGPCEFIWLFNHARFVVTNSFHGTTFSITFQKDFYSIYKQSNPYRVLNLLKQLGLENRLIKSALEIDEDHIDIDYPAVTEKLGSLRSDSKDFLFTAIEGSI